MFLSRTYKEPRSDQYGTCMVRSLKIMGLTSGKNHPLPERVSEWTQVPPWRNPQNFTRTLTACASKTVYVDAA